MRRFWALLAALWLIPALAFAQVPPGLYAPLFGAPRPATASLDFAGSAYRLNGQSYSAPSAIPGLASSRASAGYAQTSAGTLVSFGSGVPRITDLGLLDELSATNLILQSQAIDNAAWFKGTATVVADSATAPDGTLTADVVTFTGGPGANQNFQQAATTVNGSVYTLSIWLQGSGTVTLDSPGVGGSHTLTLTAAWQLFSFQYTATGTSTTLRIISSPGNTATGVTVWGAQAELGSLASSYIPTTTASVTRAADALTLTYSPNGSAGTVSYGTNSTASVSPTSPINLGSSSGGAWVGNYIRKLAVTP